MDIKLAFILLSVALGVLRIVAHRRRGEGAVRALGLPVDLESLRQLAIGVGIGTVAVAVTFLVAYLAGSVPAVNVGSAYALSDVGSYLTVAFLEELIFRAGLLGGLLVLMPNRIAAAVVLSGVVFGGLHAWNPNATAIAVFGTMLSGVTYSIAFAATRRLWLPFGVHFAWNFALGPVFGFALSGGVPARGTFLQHSTVGAAWFTGGPYGPEGGVVGQVGRAIMLILVLAWLHQRAAFRPPSRP